MGNLEDLITHVKADTAGLTSGLASADTKVSNFGSKVGKVGDTAGSSFTNAGTKVSGFGGSIDATATRADGLGSKLGRVGEIAGGFLAANVFSRGAAAFTTFLGDSIEASSSLGESLNAVSKIFGSSQQQILDWGKNNATSFGLSQRAFNELATPLGAGLKNAGLDMGTVASTTITLTERAADMASVFNTDVSEALEAIQSGLRGEADPLEKFGVGLSAAKVQAQALADTGKTTAASLTSQELAMARVKLIMDQTNTSAGDFAATSDGYANSQRIAAAKTEELQAKIGDKLVPVMLKLNEAKLALVTIIADKLLPVLGPLLDFMGRNPAVFLALAVIVGGVMVGAFTAWAVAATAAAFATLGLTWPIVAIIAAVALLVAGIVWLVSNWEWLAGVAGAVWDGITGVVSGAWGMITAVVSWGIGWITGLFSGLSWAQIISAVWDAITSTARWVWDVITGTVSWGVNAVSATLSWFGNLPGRFWEWLNSAGGVVRDWITSVVGFFSGLGGRVLHAIGNLSTTLWNSGIALVSGFWNGIISRWSEMVDWVKQGMSDLRDLWPFSPAKTGPFSGTGYVTYSGAALTSDFADSILQGMPAVAAAASRLAQTAATHFDPAYSAQVPGLTALPTPRGVRDAGGREPFVLDLRGDGTPLGDALVELIRRAVRTQGGDVQLVLGQ